MRGWRVEDITLPLHSDLLTVANSPHQLGWLNQIILQQNVVKDVYCNHGVFPNLKNIALQLYTLNSGTPLLGNLHVHEF